MTILAMEEHKPKEELATVSQTCDTPKTPILPAVVERTSDLPNGGFWWVVDLDYKEQWELLPDWMTARGVWLMENHVTVCPPWYALMPVKGGAG